MSDKHGALTKEARPPRNVESLPGIKKDLDLAFLKPQQQARWNQRSSSKKGFKL
jgi:hypothetical protein